MEYGPWEANSSLSNQQTLHILSNPKFRHVFSILLYVLVLSQISPIHVLHHVSWRSVLMLSTFVCLHLPNCVILFGFPEHIYAQFLSKCMLHTLYISSFDLSKKILWKKRDYDPPHNIIFICALPCPFMLRYHSQHPILKHPQRMFPPPCERPCFTPI